MKPISAKIFFWSAAILLSLVALYLLASGGIERLVSSTDRHIPAAVPIVRNKIPVDDIPPAADIGGMGSESVESAAGVTRTFFKPLDSEPTEAVRLEVTAIEQNNELAISGKLLDGSACSRLQVDLELEAGDGRKIFHTLILGNTGRAGARPIRSKRRLPPAADKLSVTWRAHVAAIRCLDP